MSENSIRETPLAARHAALGAKTAPFAGWNMPISYPDGIIAEHLHTRHEASIFDICHMGEMRVFGPGAAAALDRRLARPTLDQGLGVCRYNFLLNDGGGVIDDLIVYKMAEEDFFIVVNAANIDADAAALAAALPPEVKFENLSDYIGKIDLQGPKSAEVLNRLGIANADLPGYFRCVTRTISAIPCIVSRTGYTGELGFELYCDAEKIGELWDVLMVTAPVKPAGLGARDTLRLEAGLPLYGHELDADTSVIEAGFGAMLKLDALPDRDFHGRAALEQKPDLRRLVGLKLDGRRAGRAGNPVLDAAGRPVGVVTSGAFGPSLDAAVAMAYVERAHAEPGTAIAVDTGRGIAIPGRVCALPIYTEGSVRRKLES